MEQIQSTLPIENVKYVSCSLPVAGTVISNGSGVSISNKIPFTNVDYIDSDYFTVNSAIDTISIKQKGLYYFNTGFYTASSSTLSGQDVCCYICTDTTPLSSAVLESCYTPVSHVSGSGTMVNLSFAMIVPYALAVSTRSRITGTTTLAVGKAGYKRFTIIKLA